MQMLLEAKFRVSGGGSTAYSEVPQHICLNPFLLHTQLKVGDELGLWQCLEISLVPPFICWLRYGVRCRVEGRVKGQFRPAAVWVDLGNICQNSHTLYFKHVFLIRIIPDLDEG